MSSAHDDDPLSLIFAALANPTRRAILERLSRGTATVTELAEPFAMSMPAISKHLRVLERAGLITQGQEAQWRPCTLDASALKQAHAWTGQYRALWEERLGRLDDYLAQLKTDLDSSDPSKETDRD